MDTIEKDTQKETQENAQNETTAKKEEDGSTLTGCLFILFIIYGVIAYCCDWFPFEKSNTAEDIIEGVFDVGYMDNLLEKNALQAHDIFLNKTIRVKGRISHIYTDGDFCLQSTISCHVMSSSQKHALKKRSTGETITIRIRITNVGGWHDFEGDVIEIEE